MTRQLSAPFGLLLVCGQRQPHAPSGRELDTRPSLGLAAWECAFAVRELWAENSLWGYFWGHLEAKRGAQREDNHRRREG